MSQVKLGDVAVESRETYKGDKTGMPIVGLEHITPGEVTLSNWDTDTDNTFTKRFRKGDMLFGRRRAYLKKAAQAPFDGICSGDITVIRAKEDCLLPELLPFIIQNDNLFDFAVGKSAGSLSPRVKWDNLKNYTFELPPMDEQKKLAKVLWSINDTLQAYQKLFTETDALVQAQFVEMFGDPITNDKGWEMTTLGNVADIRIGPFGSLLHKGDYIEGGHALVNPSHIVGGKIISDEKLTISDEKYEELSAYKLKKGDLVLGRRGEMGRCAVVNCDGLLCGTGSLIIRPTGKIRPFFLQKILSSPSYRTVIEGKAVGITMKNLNVPIVSSLSLPLFPVSLQNKYIDFVQQSNKSQSALQNTITSLQTTKRHILENALGTGRKE